MDAIMYQLRGHMAAMGLLDHGSEQWLLSSFLYCFSTSIFILLYCLLVTSSSSPLCDLFLPQDFRGGSRGGGVLGVKEPPNFIKREKRRANACENAAF